MIGSCTICGELITGGEPRVMIVGGGVTEEDEKRQMELQEFDLLGAAMLKHLNLRHREQAAELAAVANLSSKVYAMRNCRSSQVNFVLLRAIWRDTIQRAIFREGVHEAAATGPGASGESSASPESSGSYEKNSDKNFSN